MLRNWIKVAVRNLSRRITTTILNTGGLALAISGSIVIFLLINHLSTIDRHHAKADRIYRIVQETIKDGNHDYTEGVPNPLPGAFRTDFPEVATSAFINHFYQGVLIGINDANLGMRYLELSEGVGITENSYFRILDRKIIAGDPEKALVKPYEVVVSAAVAKKLFPDQSALGKIIQINKDKDYVISGIMEDYGDNTDFPFDFFISYESVKNEFVARGWNSISSNDQFYFVLPETMTESEMNRQLAAFNEKHFDDELQERIITAQPLKELHFDTRFDNFSYRSIPRPILYAMAIVGIFLILTGCVNYINLSTAVAIKRAKEVGIRKVLGSDRSVIIRQFLSETFIVTLLAIIVGIGFAEILLRYVNQLLELNLSLNLFNNLNLWVYLFTLLLFITSFAGIYPAFVLSGYNPSKVLKKMIADRSSSGYRLRRGLVIFQFVISQVFIIGTVIVILQMKYINEKDMGFRTEAIMNIPLPEDDENKIINLKTLLENHSSVVKTSLSGTTPASGSTSRTFIELDGTSNKSIVQFADAGYMELYGLEIISGRNYVNSDTIREVVVNEEFLREFGIENPEDILGKTINIWDYDIPVVGVVKDFHTMSLREKINPLVIHANINNYNIISAGIRSDNLKATIEELKANYKKVYPEYEYEYEFFEDGIANFYEGERRMTELLGLFALFAIVIGSIGLYGLISYVTEQKTKEVGIRKVLGASVYQILAIFSKEFVILIIIAFAIAAPLTGFTMRQWLTNFEYRIDLNWVIFVTGMVATFIIALATVGYKTVKAASANPVDSLMND